MYRVYQIVNGDTLESIARKFNTDIKTLKKLNDINDIIPGMSIIVPKVDKEGNFTTYIVKKGDNLYEIARKNSINLAILREINGLEKNDYLYPDQELFIPKPGIGLHISTNGETLQDIAEKIGTSPLHLIENNKKIYILPEQLIIYKK